MKHRISPTVDCVYKAILGAVENKNLLLDFLNAVLAPQFPISDVEILNPYNEREFYSDKLTIVDVKARDKDYWLHFFKEAENWEKLPEILNTPNMRQAMAVLERFSEKEANYHL